MSARRARRGTVLGAVALLAGLLATTTPAAPAVAEPTAAPAAEGGTVVPIVRTDGVEGRMDTYASQVSRAHIWDMEVVGTTIYVAGKFTKVVEARGSWPRHDQPFLAAFDTETGRWRSEWRPRVNRPAYALAILPSGAVLAAGEFTQANGAAAEGIVALHPATGATDSRFRAGVRRPGSNHFAVIRDLFVKNQRVYAVGHFGQAHGNGAAPLRAEKAVRFHVDTGAVDRRWLPRLAGRTAYAVAVSTDNTKVHFGGEFGSVNGARGTAQVATVSVRTGALVRGWDHGPHGRQFPGVWPVGGAVFDLDVYRNSLYIAGAEHFWERRDSRTGRQITFRRIGNDAQTVEVSGRRINIGCHCFNRTPEHQVWEIDGPTGRVLPGRTSGLQSGDGTWASAVDRDGCLWLGGDFNQARAVVGLGTGQFWVGRMARLCPPGVRSEATTPESSGPVNPPWWRPDPTF